MSFSPSPWQHLRFEVLKRDSFRCTYCGATPDKSELQLDHINPRANGGDEVDINNLTTACRDCNAGKWYLLLDRYAPTLAELVTRKGRALKRLQKLRIELEEIESELVEECEEIVDLNERLQRLVKKVRSSPGARMR